MINDLNFKSTWISDQLDFLAKACRSFSLLQNVLKHFLISPWSCFTRIMNASLGLGTANSVLRIAIWCFSPDLWLEPGLAIQ